MNTASTVTVSGREDLLAPSYVKDVKGHLSRYQSTLCNDVLDLLSGHPSPPPFLCPLHLGAKYIYCTEMTIRVL